MTKIQTMAYKQHVGQSVKAILKCRYQRTLKQHKQQKILNSSDK